MLKCNVARLETSHWIELKWKLGGEHSKLSSPLHNAKTKPRMIWYHNWWGSRAVWGRRWNLNSIRFKFRYGDLITRLQHTRIFMVNFMAINHRPEPNLCCTYTAIHTLQPSQDKQGCRLQIYSPKNHTVNIILIRIIVQLRCLLCNIIAIYIHLRVNGME